MTETFNLYPDNGIPWSPPAPLHVAMARAAIEGYKRVQNAKEDPQTTIQEVA